MKIKTLLTLLFLLMITSVNLMAAPLHNVERSLTQPDGSKLYCFASGDEFYNRLHDAEGFTIVQADNGYFVYAEKDVNGKIVPTQYVAGKVDPKSVGLQPNIMISKEEYLQRKESKRAPKMEIDTKNLNHGVYNNLVVFIKFLGDEDLTTTKAEIDSMFNYDGYYDISMNNYFKKATYNQLSMESYCYPIPEGNKILAYEDIYPRHYYEPYNPTTNPEGYTDQGEREFPLLKRAIEYVADQIPDTLNIDRNDDGYVDNVIFVVKGNVGDWAELLWPHMWSLYGEDVYIHGKKVWTFNFQLETSSYFSTSTLCHEMSHSLGFPDLYHYYEGTNLTPSGGWDLMCANAHPPQHSATYMKYKYGTWIDKIPEIEYGTYTLEANSWEGGRRNCYKIPTDDPNQFYLVEYRNKENMFERALPGHGMLIYRIDTRFSGGASYNGYDSFDEVYIFRPGGSQHQDGSINAAAFSKENNKTVFNHTTNPYPFLNPEIIDEEINICNISGVGDQMTFTYCPIHNTEIVPQNLLANVDGSDSVFLEWDAVESAETYNIYLDGELLKTEYNNYCSGGVDLEDGYHEYYVTANCNGEESYRSNEVSVIIGDYCGYVFNMTSTGDYGWQGGEIKLSFDNDMDDVYYTIYSGNNLTKDIVLPVGTDMTVEWLSGWNDAECSFTIIQGDELIYDSNSQELQEGVILELEASGERPCVTPQNLTAENNGTGVYLKWTSMVESEGYEIARNGEIIASGIVDNEYFDQDFPCSGVYNYTVMSSDGNCTSAPSNEAKAVVFTYTIGEGMSMNAIAENDSINISWEAPVILGGGFRYDDGEFTNTMECTSSRSWAIKIDAERLSSLETHRLKAVELFDNEACELTFKIYNGESVHDSTLIYTEVYNAEGIGDFVMINLAEEVPYDSNKDLWITVKPSSVYNIACTEYVGEPNSCLMKTGSSWKPITDYGQYYSWLLRAYAVAPDNDTWNYVVMNNDQVMVSQTTEQQVIIPIITSGEQCLKVSAYYQAASLYTDAELCIEAFIGLDENVNNLAQIYPNPVKEMLTVNANGIKNVKIFSLTGSVLFEQEVNSNSLNINVENLVGGTYLIQIITSEGITTQRVVVNRN